MRRLDELMMMASASLRRRADATLLLWHGDWFVNLNFEGGREEGPIGDRRVEQGQKRAETKGNVLIRFALKKTKFDVSS